MPCLVAPPSSVKVTAFSSPTSVCVLPTLNPSKDHPQSSTSKLASPIRIFSILHPIHTKIIGCVLVSSVLCHLSRLDQLRGPLATNVHSPQPDLSSICTLHRAHLPRIITFQFNMSTFFYGGHGQQHLQHQTQNHHSLAQSHNHHNSRRRAPRLSASQNSQRQFRGAKAMKESNIEPPNITAFRARFEAGRSFDLEDDELYCPNLLTFDEVNHHQSEPDIPTLGSFGADLPFQRQSIHSASSDRSSLSSGSPNSSPLQQQVQPQHVTPALSLSSAATSAYMSPPAFTTTHESLKLHQPSAVRTRNAIPIVNPSTGMRVPSPPSSISPGMMQQTSAARQW